MSLLRIASAVLVVGCALAGTAAPSRAAEPQPGAAGLSPKAGESLAIYVHPAALAEAEKPGAELAASAAFWTPGPERLYGWAIRDLRDCLQRIGGAKHPLTAHDPAAGRGVFVGTFDQFPDFQPRQAGAREAVASADPEAFVIEVQGERLFILGRSELGLMAGVYTFLDGLGCKWFAPGAEWENVPDGAGLKLGEDANRASTGPSYQARYFFPSYGPNTALGRPGERQADYALWNLRNRMGGSAYTANHHNSPIIPESLFQTRPELFALVKGKRIPYELARGNPEAVEMATQIAVEYLKANEGKGSYYDSFSVETGDGVPADEESLAKVGNNTPTDLDFWFANQLAAGIEKTGLKDKWVGLYSYSDHAGIPSFDLHPRVSVMVTTALDFSSGMTVEQRLDGLRARKAQRLGVYPYLNLITWSLDKPGSHNAADPLVVAADLKRYHDHGARTYLAETSDSWVSGGPGHYLAARLMWDLRGDPRAELDAYYRGAFGPAAEQVRALYEDWAALPPKVKMPPGALPGLPKITRGRAARWHDLITTAEARVKDQPRFRARLNDVKRYYLYLNLTREFELDLDDPRLGTKAERYARMIRYVGGNRGGGAFHAMGLVPTLVMGAPAAGLSVAGLGKEFEALALNLNDEAAWKTFEPLDDARVDALFAAARLPLDGHAPVVAAGGTFDPQAKLFPADAKPPAELKFPKLHGPPAVSRQYLLHVVTPVPRLTFDVTASAPLGGGTDERTCVVTDALDREVKRLTFPAARPARFELTDLKPGFYTATFFEFGAEELTVTGGGTFGAVRAPHDTWGFNPMRRADHQPGQPAEAYFLVPAGKASLNLRLADGVVSLDFADGHVIAADVKGAAGAAPREFAFAPADRPRVARVRWAPEQLTTTGFLIDGVTLFSPRPEYVMHETLD